MGDANVLRRAAGSARCPIWCVLLSRGLRGWNGALICHTDKYAEWRQSLHSVAMTVPSDSTIVGDFDNVSHVYGGVHSRMFRKGRCVLYGDRGMRMGALEHIAWITRLASDSIRLI